MEQIEEPQPATRSGCLKWTCLGCLGVIVLSVTAVVLIVYSLKSWNQGESAWEHMPPSTIFACELHDMDALIRRGLNDGGVQRLIDSGSGHIARALSELSGEPVSNIDNIADDWAEAYNTLGFLFTAVAPNVVTMGMARDGEDPDDGPIFFIFKAPTWARWWIDLPADNGKIERHRDSGGSEYFLLSQEGWLVIASSRKLANEIRDHWNAKALPFGPAAPTSDPRVLFAIMHAPETGESGEETPPAAPDAPLMLGNPFAASGQQGADAAPEKRTRTWLDKGAGFCYRLTIKPGDDVWNTSLEFIPYDARFTNTPEEAITAARFPAREALAIPAPTDVGVICRLAPNLRDELKTNLSKKTGEGAPATAAAWQSAARIWFTEGWLAGISGDFAAYCGAPAAQYADGVPPLPVSSLVWRLSPEVDPEKAAQTFGDSLALAFEALTEGGDGPQLLQAVRESVRYEPVKGPAGVGGRVGIPPVIANSAEPVWLFPVAAAHPQGWLATDPAGLPEAGIPYPDWDAVSTPEESHMRIAAVWDVGGPLRNSAIEVILDRAGRNERLEDILDAVDIFLDAFPRGKADILLDVDAGHFILKTELSSKD